MNEVGKVIKNNNRKYKILNDNVQKLYKNFQNMNNNNNNINSLNKNFESFTNDQKTFNKGTSEL